MHCNCRSKGSKKPNKKKENKLPSYASQDLYVCLFRLIIKKSRSCELTKKIVMEFQVKQYNFLCKVEIFLEQREVAF